METWLQWARGPAFLFAFTFMVMGLLRHVAVTLVEVRRAVNRAGDKKIPSKTILIATLRWAFPLGALRQRFVFSVTSLLFHLAALIVPVFLGGHIALWARGLGISWPAIPNSLADVLTIITIVTAVALVIQRTAARATRALSRFQDYALPLVIAVPFATGFLLMHPLMNPFSYEAILLVHAISADLVFVLIPITKLTHIALIPGVQLVSEVAWHWPPDAGRKVGATLGKEGEPI